MKNYYEILEVDRNASDEIIKVAYKSLVKKYHPDLKEGIEKQTAEAKIKEINDAYDVLSNPDKKFEYDQNLSNENNISNEDFQFLLNENKQLKEELEYFKNYYNQTTNNIYRNTADYSKNNNQKYSNYETSMDDNSFNTQEPLKKNFRKNNFSILGDGLKSALALILTVLIFYIILSITPIRDFFLNLFGNGYLFFFLIIIFTYIYFFRNKH